MAMKVSLLETKGLSPSQLQQWKREMQLIVRPIVVISTVNKEGIPNAALKTNFMILKALEAVAFHCFPFHDTYENIVNTGEFVVNVPSEDLAEKIMVTAVDFPPGINEIEKAGLTTIPSEKVRPPRIAECKLHMECKLKWYKDTIIVGEVVAASADEELTQCSYDEKQSNLQQMVFLGGWKYGKISHIGDLPHRTYDDLVKHHPFREGKS